MAKYAADPHDPYLDPDTGLLRNSVGARSQKELDQAEGLFSAIRAVELSRAEPVGRYDLAHLQEVHRRLFSDVYPWAGEIRSVVIDKGETRFAMPERIEPEANRLFGQLAREQHLHGLEANDFAARAGHYMGEINALHPFREGNGRTQRAFISQLAHENGYAIRWNNISREDMTRASIEAYERSPDQLAGLIRENLIDRERASALELARSHAGPEASISFAEHGHSYTGHVLTATDRYIVQQRTDAPDSIVLHNRYRLTGDIEAQRGQPVEIRYPVGDTALVMPAKPKDEHSREVAGPDKAKDHSRGIER